MNEILLSIIVPVYNVEPYLKDCLDSFFAQDISSCEYEVVCIDDGSSDRSGEILDSYAECHDNMKVIHQGNSGVSAARNKGLDNSSGKYVWFVDSDDMIAADCLHAIKTVLSETDCDQLIILPIEFKDGEPVNCRTGFSVERLSDRVQNYLITRILKKNVIDKSGVRFNPEICCQEDNVFYTILYPFISGKAVLDDRICYYYRVRSNSLSRGGVPSERVLSSLISGAVEMKKYHELRGDVYNGYIYNLYRFVTIITGNVTYMPRNKRKAYIAELEQKGLFPLKYSELYTLPVDSNNCSFSTRIRRRIRSISYTRVGFVLSCIINK